MSKAFEKLELLGKNLDKFGGNAEEDYLRMLEELNFLEIDENFLELPQVIKISENLKNIIERCNNELMSNRNLNENERNYRFAIKDVSSEIYSCFSKEYNKQAIEHLEKEIDDSLKQINL